MLDISNISASLQDYLEVISELSEIDNENGVRITDIANKLSFAKATVNQTINKLKKMGLVTHETYGLVELTEKGDKIAKTVRKRHRIFNAFLIDILGVSNEVAQKDACIMEHSASPETINKLYEFLVKNGAIGREE